MLSVTKALLLVTVFWLYSRITSAWPNPLRAPRLLQGMPDPADTAGQRDESLKLLIGELQVQDQSCVGELDARMDTQYLLNFGNQRLNEPGTGGFRILHVQEFQQHYYPWVPRWEERVLEAWNIFPLLQAFDEYPIYLLRLTKTAEKSKNLPGPESC